MHRDRVQRARRIALLAAFFIPIAQLSHATDGMDGMLYARAIGDPQLPAADAPMPPPAPTRDIPELPTLGTAPPQTQTVPATESSGWSWKQILIGLGVVVAISAIASRGGGTSGSDNSAPPVTDSPPPPNDGGGGIAAPTPTPEPAPSPPPPPSGGGGGDADDDHDNDDDDDDKDKKRGKGDRRIIIPAFSASF